jgi:transcriptional regulator with XRE-family HTH domain
VSICGTGKQNRTGAVSARPLRHLLECIDPRCVRSRGQADARQARASAYARAAPSGMLTGHRHRASKGDDVARESTASGFDPEALREARIHANMTQAELAERVGIAHTTIARYEAGERIPYVERLATIARALGLTSAALTKNSQPGGLAQLRSNAGLSQHAAAQRADLVRTTYAAIERGEVANLDPDIVARLADALAVDQTVILSAHSISRAERLRRV